MIAPVAAAVLWGMFVAPRARRPASEPVRWAIEFLVFGAAFVALLIADRGALALLFALLAVADGFAVRALSPERAV